MSIMDIMPAMSVLVSDCPYAIKIEFDQRGVQVLLCPHITRPCCA